MPAQKKVGLYLDPGTIVRNPGYLEACREQMGLNHVIISFTGEIPAEMSSATPFDGVPPSAECMRRLLGQHLDGQPITAKFESAYRSLGPRPGEGGDEAGLRTAIEQAHAAGLEVWLLGGGWCASDYDHAMYCPSKEVTNRWLEALYVHYATQYGVEGLDITHARYTMTSEPRGLFVCMCPDCARSAAELGYDMAQIRSDIVAAWERLRKLDGRRVAALAKAALGFFDLLQLLGMRPGIMQWFSFRAELLARNLARLRATVHAAAGTDFIFGTDTYPASLSMFVGHSLPRWGDMSDFASPLLSHADIFPLKTIVRWAEFLRSLYPEISERDALEVVHCLTGYHGLGLPTTVADYALGAPDGEYRHVPLKELILRDMAKARLYLPPTTPSYPIIQGGGAPWDWPRPIVDDLVAGADALGHSGVIFQGTRQLVNFDLKR
jgi:hypothetical protein